MPLAKSLNGYGVAKAMRKQIGAFLLSVGLLAGGSVGAPQPQPRPAHFAEPERAEQARRREKHLASLKRLERFRQRVAGGGRF